MTPPTLALLVSKDSGLLAHWQSALGKNATQALTELPVPDALPASATLWYDMGGYAAPQWSSPQWQTLLGSNGLRVVATSSSPSDAEGIAALDAGCTGYCHAFSDAATLRQVQASVAAGQIWIGTSLMQRLLQIARKAAPPERAEATWDVGLTAREREVAVLAANGASNQQIALECSISERTVKAHLGAVFAKLNLTDRLQLALRVHGIH
jgi:DNA-binding NarL/FixJ family response regulator